MLQLRFLFVVTCFSTIITTFNSTIVDFHAAVLDYKGAGVPGDGRLVIMNVLCSTYTDDTNGECSVSARQIIAVVYNTTGTLQRLGVSMFNNPYQDTSSTFAIVNSLVVETKIGRNPYVYATLDNYENNQSPVLLRYELLPNSTLVALSPIKIVAKISGTQSDIHQPLFTVLASDKSILFSWGRNGDYFSLVRFNLTNSSLEKYAVITTVNPAYGGQADYVPEFGKLLYDSDYNRLVMLSYDVFLIEPDNLTLISSLFTNGSISAGAIDIVQKKIYYLDIYGGALWRVSYNKTAMWRDYSYFYAPNQTYPKGYLQFDSSFHLLYVMTFQRAGVGRTTDSLDVWDTTKSAFDEPYKRVVQVLGNEGNDGNRPFAELMSSTLFTMNADEDLTRVELLGLYSLINNCPPNTTLNCLPCSPGTFYNTIDYSCTVCPDLTYAPGLSMPACLPCGLPSANRSSCYPCPPEQEDPQNQSFCHCKAGYGVTSFSTCSQCTDGTYKSVSGSEPCSSCGLFSTTTNHGTECICLSNYYFAPVSNQNRSVCEPCPPEALCNGSAYISGQATFWRPRGSDLTTFVQCPLLSACQAEDMCAPEYDQSSFLCGECAEGYSIASSLEGCVACEQANAWILALFCILAPLMVLRLYRGTSTANVNNFVAVGILINHMQILAELGLGMSGSLNITSIFSFLHIFQFQFLSLSSNACVFPGKTFLIQWLARLLVTLILLVLAFLVASITRMMRSTETSYLWNFARVSVNVLKFCFIGNTKLVLMAFACASDDKRSDPAPFEKEGSAVTVFTYYPSLVCFEGEHVVIFSVALVFFVLYVLGTIVSLAFLLCRRKSIDVSFLTGPYVPECPFWELVVLARRFAVAVVTATTQSSERNWLLSLVMFISLGASIHKRPYLQNDWRWLDLASLHTLHATFLLGVLLSFKETDSDAILILILVLNFGFVLCTIVYSVWQAIQSRKKHKSDTNKLELAEFPQQI